MDIYITKKLFENIHFYLWFKSMQGGYIGGEGQDHVF